MKKYLLLMLMAIGLASCVTVEQVTHTNIIDYSRFTKNGIFVTESNTVNFDYEPLGSVVATSRGPVASYLVAMTVDMDKAFSDIGKKLKEINADGLINLKITNYADKYYYFTTVSGMAIRRNPIGQSVVTTYQEVLGYIDLIKLEVAYDMAMGTSQMLGCLTERLKSISEDVTLTCFGQEFNPETYAIAKADMLIKGGPFEYMFLEHLVTIFLNQYNQLLVHLFYLYILC